MPIPGGVISPGAQHSSLKPVIFFVLLAGAGVFYAKWDPYYVKMFAVAVHHTLGASIVTGHRAEAPAVGWVAALRYTVTYFRDIWVALVVGLVVGAGVQTLLPRDWLLRVLGRAGWTSAALAAAAAVPSMMCTCCSAPIAVSLKKSDVPTGAVLAYWLGNPVLNPATVVFMGFVLGWDWALLRVVMGILVVVGAAYLGQRWSGITVPRSTLARLADANCDEGPTVSNFFKVLGRLVVGLLPEYIVIVALLGATRAWLFPAMNPMIGHSLVLMLLLAIAGTIFVIPTAGEIPIIQTLMAYGLATGSAGVLMMTLPAISLPSMAMVSQAIPKRQLALLGLFVALAGLATGFVASLVL